MTEIETKVAELEATEKKIQEQQAALATSTAAVEEKESQKAALDKELVRVQTEITKAKEDRRNEDASFQTKMRGENIKAASEKLFKDFGIKPEDQEKFLETFKAKFDSGAVNQELIYGDMETAYVAQHPKEMLAAKRIADKLKENAVEYDRIASSAGFSGGGLEVRTGGVELDAADIEAARYSGMPLETYKKLKAEGKLDK